MRLLIIAPDIPGISWSSEVERITADHHASVIAGEVTEERLTNATAGRSFDVVHVASHGTDEGIELSNGDMLSPAQLAQLVKHVRADLVFLNSCRSLYLAQYLIDQHVPAVLSHTVQVLDEDALRLASYYYEELTRTHGDMYAAYLAITPRNGSLSWSSNGGYVERSFAPLLARLDSMEALARRQVQVLLWFGVAFALHVSVTAAHFYGVL